MLSTSTERIVRLLALTLLLGDLCFQQLMALPGYAWQGPLIISVLFYIFFKPARPLAGLALGFFLAFAHAQGTLSSGLDPALEGRDLVAVGTLVGLPEHGVDRTRLRLDIDELMFEGQAVSGPPRRILLSWYGETPPLAPGQRWRLTVRLKQPHGFLNPGGFDYEGWLFQRGIRATGMLVGSDR